MGNVYKSFRQQLKLSIEYSEAKALFEEKRRLQARVAEIDRNLREIAYLDPAAVQAARSEVPFRRPHGRPKATNQPLPSDFPSALAP